MLESILLTVGQYWHLILPVVIVAFLASNYLNKGLYQYPGPALARFTNAWRFVDVLNRRPDITHVRLHREHGDVIRLGPNTLSFSDPAAIKTIYGLNKGFVKVCGSIILIRSSKLTGNSLDFILHSRLCPKAKDYRRYSQRQMNPIMQTYDDQSIVPFQ